MKISELIKLCETNPEFIIGDKVKSQLGAPISARFDGVGEITDIRRLPNISGGYEVIVMVDGEEVKTREDLIMLAE